MTLEGIGGIYGRKHSTIFTGIRKIENFLELHDKKTEELMQILSLGVNKKLRTNLVLSPWKKVNINLSGISSSSVYTDGEMMSLVNLRKKTGALEPVPPRKVSKVLKEEADIVFIHNIPNVGEQWIYVTQNNIYQEKPTR